MFGAGFEIAKPPGWFFDFPPRQDPPVIPPPQNVYDWRAPFNVDPSLYRAVLEPKVPITVAAVYFFTVKIMNQINRRRGFKPYGFSKTNAWWLFCVVHNILLALYSGVTFLGMVRAIYVSLPGWFGPRGVPGQLDALCKMHGPRGFGDAIPYNPNTMKWTPTNHIIHLGADALTPDSTDVGRIWNEGLAFWGWFFYLSKFYEVIDTAIILASGKRSATLQTYHHTGAMLCMWAGIRYMSPPIWLFVYLNSFIHTIMYTYYTLHLFRVSVPKSLKRTLTTAQISQFLIGVYFASAHLFVKYTIPTSVPAGLAAAAASAPSAASSIASSAFSAAGKLMSTASLSSVAAAATADNFLWLKKLALRAANFEGAAENLDSASVGSLGSAANLVSRYGKELQYAIEYQNIRCLDTQAQAFAIWLNVVYLAPLTFLFGRFFLKAYIRGPAPSKSTANGKARNNTSPVSEAARRTTLEFERQGTRVEQNLDLSSEVHTYVNGVTTRTVNISKESYADAVKLDTSKAS